MTKRPKTAPPESPRRAASAPRENDLPGEAQPAGAVPSLHDLFNQQVREVLESSDLDEEQKQEILVAMSCPCCGGGSASIRFKLRRPA